MSETGWSATETRVYFNGEGGVDLRHLPNAEAKARLAAAAPKLRDALKEIVDYCADRESLPFDMLTRACDAIDDADGILRPRRMPTTG